MTTKKELNKDLALITSIIINEDILGGTVLKTFDQAYELAKDFQDLYRYDFNWKSQDLDFDEAIIRHVNSLILKQIDNIK